MTKRRDAFGRLGTLAFDLVLIAVLGASASLAHIGWYRLFETSVAVDAVGSALVGGLFAVGAWAGACGPRPPARRSLARCARRVPLAFAAGVVLHASQAPAFTPFGLSPAGVNRVLFLGGTVVGLLAVGARRQCAKS